MNITSQKDIPISFEVFPPKKDGEFEAAFATLDKLGALAPAFISVTYGAGGSNSKKTVEIASYIQNQLKLPALAHITCVGSRKQALRDVLADLKADGVENVLALRGDVNPDYPPKTDFKYASELVAYIRERGDFGVSAACYPEGHVESASLAADIDALRQKQEAGASHLVTQLFFDNLHYYRFVSRARKAGVGLPVSAGVMPIVSARQIERTVKLSSASLPPAFTKMISRWQNDEQGLFEAGIEYAVNQLRDLIEGGTDGVHLYAMNNAEVARRVFEGIADLLPTPKEGV